MLITLLMMAIVLPAAIEAANSLMVVAADAQRKDEATHLAESKLAEMVATRGWKTAELSGPFPEPYDRYTWSIMVGEWVEPNIQQVDVAVTWTTGRRGEETVVVSTLVYENNEEAATGQIGGSR